MIISKGDDQILYPFYWNYTTLLMKYFHQKLKSYQFKNNFFFLTTSLRDIQGRHKL